METNALAGPDAITLPAGTYELAIVGANEEGSLTGDLDIIDDLTISGEGAANTVIDAGGLDRSIHVLPSPAAFELWLETEKPPRPTLLGPTLDISGVTIRNGAITEDDAIKDSSYGGGIASRGGTLIITNSIVSGNSATLGGGISDLSGTLIITGGTVSGNSAMNGGGILSTGVLILINSTVSDNSASNDGGGIWGTGGLTLADSTVSDNTATNGGGIYLIWHGSPYRLHGGTFYDSFVTENSASREGGGIWGAAPLTVIDSLFSGNSSADNGGPDIFADRKCFRCGPGTGLLDIENTALSDDPVLANSFKQAAKAHDTGDYDTALDIRLTLANKGNVRAQRLVGRMLFDGDGVEQNYEGAAHWWGLAAAQGSPEAQNELGVLYQQGLGVEQDYEKAANWFHAAAGQGNQWAQINIGGLWFNGDGVSQDYVMAAFWFANAQVGEDADAVHEAIKWISTTNLVARNLNSSGFDPFTGPDEDREKLTGDNLTAAFMTIIVAAIIAAGESSDWGKNPVEFTEHQRRLYDCQNWYRYNFRGGTGISGFYVRLFSTSPYGNC